jgi:predicted metal-binding protein
MTDAATERLSEPDRDRVHGAHVQARARHEALGHRLLRSRGVALARDPSRAEAADDLAQLEEIALASGATRARAIAASQVVVDERVTMKCRLPPCEHYGSCHLCPPYSPTAREFASYLAAYRHALLVQVQTRLSESFKQLVEAGEDTWYRDLLRQPAWAEAYYSAMMPLWHRLHLAMTAVEQTAIRQGHGGALGLGAGSCRFCEPAGLEERCRLLGLAPPPARDRPPPARSQGDPAYASCDMTQPCPFPDVARPAMEAVGIDVVRTLRNAGWELRFPASSYPEDVVFYTGLVLVA